MSFKKISRRCSDVISFPRFCCEMILFWQKMHFNVQPEKKTAPEPKLPEMTGSSQ